MRLLILAIMASRPPGSPRQDEINAGGDEFRTLVMLRSIRAAKVASCRSGHRVSTAAGPGFDLFQG